MDCKQLATMPNVSFTIGDKVFDLSAKEVWHCTPVSSKFKTIVCWSLNATSVLVAIRFISLSGIGWIIIYSVTNMGLCFS